MTKRKPKRIQRRRTKGWRLPEGAVIVTRPTKWGNPASLPSLSRQQKADLYREFITEVFPQIGEHARQELRGKDLCCWCPLDEPCHAAVLLEVANGWEPGSAGP